MPSPFPGMDPFLEWQVWQEVWYLREKTGTAPAVRALPSTANPPITNTANTATLLVLAIMVVLLFNLFRCGGNLRLVEPAPPSHTRTNSRREDSPDEGFRLSRNQRGRRDG